MAKTFKSQAGKNNPMFGKIPWNKGLEGFGKWSKTKGMKFGPRSEEVKKRISESNRGQKRTEETKGKIKEARAKQKNIPSGKKHWNYKGGISIGENKMDYIVALTRKRRYLKRGIIGTHNLQDWINIKIFYGFMCLCCKKCEPEIILTEDHIIPLSKGGTHNIENIQPLCRSCNARKFTQIVDYRKDYEKVV